MSNRQIQNIRKHRITILRPSLHTQCVLWVWWVKLFFFPSYVEFKMFFLLDPLKIQREKSCMMKLSLHFFFHLHALKFTFLCWVECCCSVRSDSLWPHGLQHARLPCPSPTPGICSNSCPLSQWCHPTILASVTPFSSCPPSFPASVVWVLTNAWCYLTKTTVKKHTGFITLQNLLILPFVLSSNPSSHWSVLHP